MRLIVVRHAKSSWVNPVSADHDRPLSPRGRRATELIGNWLLEQQFIPRLVLCSSARRARETWQGIGRMLPPPDAVITKPDLYHASAYGIAQIGAKADRSPALIVGHNPGIGEFAYSLCGNPGQHPDLERYPTGATLVCDIDAADLSALKPRSGRLVAFVVPRELE